jgi:hypothetical protein
VTVSHLRIAARAAAFLVASAATAGAQRDAEFRAVWGSGPGDIWVGGSHGVVHFDGTTWGKVPIGEGGRAAVSAIWGSGRDQVLAASGRTVYRWNGQAWSVDYQLGPDWVVSALTGRSSSVSYATANRTGIMALTSRTPATLLRGDGSTWTSTPLPLFFDARAVALQGADVLVAGSSPNGADGILARLRAGAWSVGGWNQQGPSDSLLASARWLSVGAAGDIVLLAGENRAREWVILRDAGGGWTALPSAAAQPVRVRLAFLSADGVPVVLLQDPPRGVARFVGGQWVSAVPPSRNSAKPAEMSNDDWFLLQSAWAGVADGAAVWAPSAQELFVATRHGLVIRISAGSASIVYAAVCDDAVWAAREEVLCRRATR